MISSGEHDRLTLQQYLQTYNIKKKIQQRKKSKSKGKDSVAMTEQQRRMNSVFADIDLFLEQTKIELHEILMNTQFRREKTFFYVSKQLDELTVKLKDQISKMYKEVYEYYKIESQEGDGANGNKQAENYFKQKMNIAKQEKKHATLGEVVRQNFKKEQNTAFLTKLIFQQNFKERTPFMMDNNTTNNVAKDYKNSNSPQQKKKSASKEKAHQPKQLQHLKNGNQLKLPPSPVKKNETAGQIQADSLFKALFVGLQPEDPSNSVTASPPIKTNTLLTEQQLFQVKYQRPFPSQRGSKLNRPFQRKTSIKEIMNSPKGKKVLKNVSPYR